MSEEPGSPPERERDSLKRERDPLSRAKRVRLMLFDVDGVLTDGRLWYGPGGEALKAFHVADGLGFGLLKRAGCAVALLSGRSSAAVAARAKDLAIEHVLQGIEDKRAAFEALIARLGVKPEETGFMGDDLIDLPVLRRCGFACAPPGAHDQVRAAAHYVTRAHAGGGAAREVCEYLLGAQGRLDEVLARYLA